MMDVNKPRKRDIESFKEFARNVATIRTPQQEDSYRQRFGRIFGSVSDKGFSKEEINEILASGDVTAIRELSKYFTRFSGTYSRAIQYYSSLLNYSYTIIPHYDREASVNSKKIKKQYKETSLYMERLNLRYNLPRINRKIFEQGVYYGILRELDNGQPLFLDLPVRYCRSRFNDENGLPILELDCSYFDMITSSDIERKAILSFFPKYVANKYYNKKKNHIWWIEIPPADGGICFRFNESGVPPLVPASGTVADLALARDRETARDTEALQKILIQKLPIDKVDGELLFSLEEAAELHRGTCNMLRNMDTIDVLTTYAEVKLENVQDPESAATASTSRLDKYVKSVYDELGIAGEIFNPSGGSTALIYSIKKDISIIFAWSQIYEIWINSFLKAKAKNEKLYFSISFFPTSSIFQTENVDMFLKIAQYGYPKNMVAGTLGMDMEELLQITHFENEVCNITEALKPLQSSYTTSNEKNSNSSGESSRKTNSSPDLTNEGGRPEKPLSERSDKTMANRDAT